MHALPKRELHTAHTLGTICSPHLLHSGQYPYQHSYHSGRCLCTDLGHNPQIHKDPYSLLPMWQTHQVAQDLHTTNGSLLHVGCTMLQRVQGATTTLAKLPTAAAHVGDLILPLCVACLSIQRELNVLSGARVHPLQPKAEHTKLQLCQTIQA